MARIALISPSWLTVVPILSVFLSSCASQPTDRTTGQATDSWVDQVLSCRTSCQVTSTSSTLALDQAVGNKITHDERHQDHRPEQPATCLYHFAYQRPEPGDRLGALAAIGQ